MKNIYLILIIFPSYANILNSIRSLFYCKKNINMFSYKIKNKYIFKMILK